jgi:disulfide bond formation protein DsbB
MRLARHSGQERRVTLPKVSPRLPLLFNVLLPVTLVAIAVALSVYLQLAACPLCIVQRMMYLGIAFASLAGLFFPRQVAARNIAALLAAALSIAGASAAGYQVYLQRNPFAATCGAGSSWWEHIVERAGEFWPLLFRADGLCSDDSWKLFGLSLAEWSVVAFAGCFFLAICSALLKDKR